MARPVVGYLALGGTIASVSARPGEPAAPGLGADDIARAVAGLDEVADLRGVDVAQVGSARLTLPHLLRVVAEAERLVADGAAGVVVTQGTDSIEESAFALDLMWSRPEPLVVTGAMRGPSRLGADGPANFMAAVRTATAAAARDLGVLVVMNDEVHAARWVRKTQTSSPAAFVSWPGPLGWGIEERVELPQRLARRPALTIDPHAQVPPVALLTSTLGEDARLVSSLAGLGYAGAVIAGFGGGHVPVEWVEPLGALVETMPVVLASRAGVGEVLTNTYGYAGGEVDLLGLGLTRAGALDPLKARLLLQLALMAKMPAEQAFSTYAGSSLPGSA